MKSFARVLSIVYLLTAPALGIFGIMYIPMNIVKKDDPEETRKNVIMDEFLIRILVLCGFLGQFVHVFWTLGLYKIYGKVDSTQAFIMLTLSLLPVPITFLTEAFCYGAILCAKHEGCVYTDLMMILLELREFGIQVSQIFWGLWLFPYGVLVFKSGLIPKWIGVTLMIACCGYVVDSVCYFLGFEGVDFSVFTFWGEVICPIWMIMGIKSEIMEKKE